jgi:hypothetical protein
VLFRFIQRVDLSAASGGYQASNSSDAHVCALFDQEFADLGTWLLEKASTL